jgi:hypothetical protein
MKLYSAVLREWRGGVASIGQKTNGLKFLTDHDPTAKDKPSLVEDLLDWEFTPSVKAGMDGYIVDPKMATLEDLEQTAWSQKENETVVLATLKLLPANYLDDEHLAGTKRARSDEEDNDNDSPPTKKRKRSFKKFTNEWCGRKRFGGWTDSAIHQMIDWCVSIRRDRVDKKYLNMEKVYHLWAGIREFGKEGKKRSKDRNSPQAQPINTSMAWDLDFMISQSTAPSTITGSDQEDEEQGN